MGHARRHAPFVSPKIAVVVVLPCRGYSMNVPVGEIMRERDNIFGGGFAVCEIFINFAASSALKAPLGYGGLTTNIKA